MKPDQKSVTGLLSQYVEKKLSNLRPEERAVMEAAVQVLNLDGPVLRIQSGLIVDLSNLDSVRGKLSFNQIDPEFCDRSNWEKWRSIEPVLIADLEKSEAIAEEVSKRYGLKLTVEILHAEVYLETKVIDERAGGLLPKGCVAVDALFEAWHEFKAWLHGAERLRVVRKSGKHKDFLDRL